MLILTCPNCGERNVAEFRFGGECKKRPPNPADPAANAAWADYLYLKENKSGGITGPAAAAGLSPNATPTPRRLKKPIFGSRANE